MKRLFLDDDPERHRVFKMLYPDADYVWTAAEAIKAIQDNQYQVIHLDHDLGGRQYVDSEDPSGTGLTVARAIVERYARSRLTMPEVVIHSFNREGMFKMLAVLYASGFDVSWKPFRNFA